MWLSKSCASDKPVLEAENPSLVSPQRGAAHRERREAAAHLSTTTTTQTHKVQHRRNACSNEDEDCETCQVRKEGRDARTHRESRVDQRVHAGTFVDNDGGKKSPGGGWGGPRGFYPVCTRVSGRERGGRTCIFYSKTTSASQIRECERKR